MSQGFNTQPPEGGWICSAMSSINRIGFNTQPPEGGWYRRYAIPTNPHRFQHTAARRRLGNPQRRADNHRRVSTHSRPKAAGPSCAVGMSGLAGVSTHSRPKAAGASLKSLAPSGFAALISLSSQEKREREYNTAFSVTPAFAIS